MIFYRIEKVLLAVIALIAILDIALISSKGTSVDVAGYVSSLSLGMVMLIFGQFYRTRRPNEGIALAFTATAILILFSNLGSAFNYLLLPRPSAPIDPFLVRIDALIGYHWPTLAGWAAQSSVTAETLRFVYLTSLPQLVLAVLFLGFGCHRRRLYVFLSAGMMSALLAIVVWAIFPSSSASAYWSLPEEVNARSFTADTI